MWQRYKQFNKFQWSKGNVQLFLIIFAPMKRLKPILFGFCAILLMSLIASCSVTKFVPDDEYMLSSVAVHSDDSDFKAEELSLYVRQKANSKWFSLFRIPLATYSLAGRDTTKRINRFLQKIGEAPVIYDSLQAELTRRDLISAMNNRGYMQADAIVLTKKRGRKLKAEYIIHPGKQYYIDRIDYEVDDENIAQMLHLDVEKNQGLYVGVPFTIEKLDAERKRVTALLLDSGYYHFNKDFIQYTADTAFFDPAVDVVFHLHKYQADRNAPFTDHPRYTIRSINYFGGDSNNIHLRKKVLEDNTALRVGEPFSSKALQKTYNNFSRLQAVRFTNISFNEDADSCLLDCNIQISTNKPSTLSFQPEGTNTAGDLGAAVSLTYENRNLFKGSELLSLQLRGAFEAITDLEGYQNENYEEYGVEAKLSFPRFLAPFVSKNYRLRSSATSELALSYNLQNRPEFHRRVFSTIWRYRWTEPLKNLSYRFDLLDLNYVYMPWISSTFKNDYLDNESSRNAILRYNYEDLLITKIGFGISYNKGNHAVRANIETSGNLLNGLSHAFHFKQNNAQQYTLFNIAYAQYAKFDIDYTHLKQFDEHNQLAFHCGLGVAYPYGNSNVLPFEKRYFSGGANSVRGWNVRSLGPGSFKGTDGRIDFINQTGDMKLDLNLEYRTYLFWKFAGAAFIDAGNIWTLRAYNEQPGGQFKFNEFYKQIAVAYGLGFRLNFDYFIMRFDMGMKAINPAYDTDEEHYSILHPNFSRDLSVHFAVGLPF